MAYRYEQNPLTQKAEIVIDGWENGIAVSPHRGLGNIQNANIATEEGEILCNYARFQQNFTSSSGAHTLTATVSGLQSPITTSGTNNLGGVWITVSSSTITNVPPGNYYVYKTTHPGNFYYFFLSTTYNGTDVAPGTTGTATYTVMTQMGLPIDKATEQYLGDFNNQQTRYYILDTNGYVWVYDTAISGANGLTWFLPYNTAFFGATETSGIDILNGWLFAFGFYGIFAKPTVNLDTGWATFYPSTGPAQFSSVTINIPRKTLVGHQGELYFTDGNYIGSIFPNSSNVSGVENIQSYCRYTAVTTTGTINTLINGVLPKTSTSATRIPVVPFCATTGTLPTALTADTIYWIAITAYPGLTFSLYAAQSGGSPLDIATGSSGRQYFNSFYATFGGATLMDFSQERLVLPTFEQATSLEEIGNQVIIGGRTNTLYPWDQVSNLPGNIILLPEDGTYNIINVNNTAYIFAGNKGNIYITNGSAVSRVLSVPDYCGGTPGNVTSYVEPMYRWGDAMYLRGRIYFSINNPSTLTLTQTPVAGGVWSFIPSQNFSTAQDTGLALRLESQNSYGDYDGVCTVLLPSVNQNFKYPQYWTGWTDSAYITTGVYTSWASDRNNGIDFTDVIPVVTSIIETDLIPTGTVMQKQTFQQIEYKLGSPLVASESIAINYRLNGTDTWTTCGTAITEGVTNLSGYFTVPFQNTQWIQLQIILTSNNLTTSSFCRLRDLRIK